MDWHEAYWTTYNEDNDNGGSTDAAEDVELNDDDGDTPDKMELSDLTDSEDESK